jgi:ubiquinone/menaquinone biosynthesis C-methylase UbiE
MCKSEFVPILTERATGLTEILDGNVEAFERLRAVASDVTLAGAQQLVVDTIERMERTTRGHVAVADALLRVAQERVAAERPIRILEVASGSGWLLTNLHRRALRRGIEIELTGSDLNGDLVESMERRLAHNRVPASTRVFDASDMTEVPDAAYDAAFMMFTLHHLRGDDNVRVLRELDRVSRGGMMVVDATRSLLALLAVPTLATLLAPRGGRRFARFDAKTTVRRAYTAAEMRLLVREAGLSDRYHVGPLPTRHPERLIANAIWPRHGPRPAR